MRRTRERRREGRLSIRCDISSIQREALATAGFIDPVKLEDAAEVAGAVARAIDSVTRWVPVANLTSRRIDSDMRDDGCQSMSLSDYDINDHAARRHR
jgi:hypothetical protein